jgi:hypothetical protein
MRTARYSVTEQRVVVIPYRRFGATCRANIDGSEDGRDILSHNVRKELTLISA